MNEFSLKMQATKADRYRLLFYTYRNYYNFRSVSYGFHGRYGLPHGIPVLRGKVENEVNGGLFIHPNYSGPLINLITHQETMFFVNYYSGIEWVFKDGRSDFREVDRE